MILIPQAANCRSLRKGQRVFCVWQGSLVSSSLHELPVSMQNSCPVAHFLFPRLDLSAESLKNLEIIKMVTCSSVDKGNVFVCIHCLKFTTACHAFHSLYSLLVLAFTRILPFLFFLLSSC